MEITAWNVVLAYIPILAFGFTLFKYFGSNIQKKIDEKVDKVLYEERVKSERALYDEKLKVYDERFNRFEDKLDSLRNSQQKFEQLVEKGMNRIEESINKLHKENL